MYSLSDQEMRRLARKLLPTSLHTPTFEEQGKYVVMLGELRDERCLAPLATMLSHRDRNMRILAINAIREINSPATRHILEQCLIDSDESVREAARIAIREIRKGVLESPVSESEPIKNNATERE